MSTHPRYIILSVQLFVLFTAVDCKNKSIELKNGSDGPPDIEITTTGKIDDFHSRSGLFINIYDLIIFAVILIFISLCCYYPIVLCCFFILDYTPVSMTPLLTVMVSPIRAFFCRVER